MIVIVRAAAALPFASATLAPPFNLAGGGRGRPARSSSSRSVAERSWRPRLAIRRSAPADRALGRRGPGGRQPDPPRRPAATARPRRGRTGPSRRPAAAGPSRGWSPSSRPPSSASGPWRSPGPTVASAITVLDVGQGDAILVDGDRGARMLIDGGPDPDRLLVALDAHVPAWDRRIDLLVLTHPHEDHVAGMALLLQRYRVSRVVEPGMRGPGPGYRAWAAELAAEGRSAGRLATGDSFALDDVRFDVLWPDRGAVPAEPATPGPGSTTSRSSCSGRSDASGSCSPATSRRASTRRSSPAACPGSTSSRSPITAAGRRRRGRSSTRSGRGSPPSRSAPATRTAIPAPATIERLRERKAEVFRTDLDGTVVVTLDGTRGQRPCRGRPGRATTTARPIGSTATAASRSDRASGRDRRRLPLRDPAAGRAGPARRGRRLGAAGRWRACRSAAGDRVGRAERAGCVDPGDRRHPWTARRSGRACAGSRAGRRPVPSGR